jgi:hypothetical protein
MTRKPDRIARLDVDPRGYAIPWNVLRGPRGEAFFTVNDDRKHWRALRQGLCPICGEILGRWKWFVGGPRSAFEVNGWYLDLPMHHECCTYALETCPYLAMPKYLKRVDVADPSKLPAAARILIDETITPERPELNVAVAGNQIEGHAGPSALSLPYVRPCRPALAYEFWRHGLKISLSEAMPMLQRALGSDWQPPALLKP